MFLSLRQKKTSQPKPSGKTDNSLTAGRKKIEQKRKELERLKQKIELKQIEQKRQELEKLVVQLEKEETTNSKEQKVIEKKPELEHKKIQVKKNN